MEALVHAPVDAEQRVVEANARIVLRRIEVGDFVEDHGVRLERQKCVRETDGNEDLVAFLGTKQHGKMLAESRRVPPQIDGDIADAPGKHADELRLRERLLLKVETAQGPARLGYGDVILNEDHVDAGLLEPALVVGFAEKAARVVKALRLQDEDT